MDAIFLQTHDFDSNDKIGSLYGLKDQTLSYLFIEKIVEENQIHWILKESFKECIIKPGDSLLNAIKQYGTHLSVSSLKDHLQMTRLEIVPGNYYPRVFRPFIQERRSFTITSDKIEDLEDKVNQYSDFLYHDKKLFLDSLSQLATLKEMLIEICKTVYPSGNNLATYGHEIKNLLVLACIEVETQLKGVFKANEGAPKTSYSTNDYVKLKSIMQLDRYEVKLPFYPDINSISPFLLWSPSQPTSSLGWYDAYNAVKHNSELDFHRANLENAISAISAVAILLRAQYGDRIQFWREKIGSFFYIVNNTEWANNEKILPPFVKNDWRENKVGL